MSVDTHKFGMAHKGTSVVLYHDPALRKHQYTSITEWSGETPAGCCGFVLLCQDALQVLGVHSPLAWPSRCQMLPVAAAAAWCASTAHRSCHDCATAAAPPARPSNACYWNCRLTPAAAAAGGLYISPTMAGSRPGALIATAWASMMALGKEGYVKSTQAIMGAARAFAKGLEKVPCLEVSGLQWGAEECLTSWQRGSSAQCC